MTHTIIYFQKTERGFASFNHSPMCYYPHRDCDIHEGFVILTEVLPCQIIRNLL